MRQQEDPRVVEGGRLSLNMNESMLKSSRKQDSMVMRYLRSLGEMTETVIIWGCFMKIDLLTAKMKGYSLNLAGNLGSPEFS